MLQLGSQFHVQAIWSGVVWESDRPEWDGDNTDFCMEEGLWLDVESEI